MIGTTRVRTQAHQLIAARARFWLATLAFLAPKTSAANSLCPRSDPLQGFAVPLRRTAAKLRAGLPLVVVAIGSSSTVGIGLSGGETYPSTLQKQLSAHFPRSRIRVLNKGVSGESFRQMLARFDRDVLAYGPDLVIWQLGTNAILSEDGVRSDETEIQGGVERLKVSGSDVVLMSPQYAPRVVADPDCPTMLHLLDEVAQRERVPLFHRFEVMHDWVTASGNALSRFVAADKLHLSDLGYFCLGESLAEAITQDIDERNDSPK